MSLTLLPFTIIIIILPINTLLLLHTPAINAHPSVYPLVCVNCCCCFCCLCLWHVVSSLSVSDSRNNNNKTTNALYNGLLREGDLKQNCIACTSSPWWWLFLNGWMYTLCSLHSSNQLSPPSTDDRRPITAPALFLLLPRQGKHWITNKYVQYPSRRVRTSFHHHQSPPFSSPHTTQQCCPIFNATSSFGLSSHHLRCSQSSSSSF